MAYTKHLEVALDSDSGRAGCHLAHDPKLGRYVVRGLVVAGIKSMLYRRVYLTHREKRKRATRRSRPDRSRNSDTGTETEVHTGGSHSARH